MRALQGLDGLSVPLRAANLRHVLATARTARTVGPLLCALLGGCATYGRPLAEVAPEINSTLYTGPTLIEPGDTLDLRFAHKTEWNQAMRVRPDGNLSFPGIGGLRVGGVSVADLERALGDKYHTILELDREVTINVTDPPGTDTSGGQGGVVVSGEVTRPGLVTI